MRGLSVLLLALTLGCEGRLDAGPAPPRGACLEDRAVPAALRRLTPTEYRNSVADVFRGAALPEVTLTPDLVLGGFDNNAAGQPVSDLLTEDYFRASGAIGAAVAADLGSWAPCTDESAACAERITVLVLRRALRRPPADEELAAHLALVEATRAESGLADAIGALAEAVLLEPQFLYRPELGTPRTGLPPGIVALDDHELASRLSYLFWRTIPDDALLEAAGAGELQDDAMLEAQARRLLEDPRGRATISDLHRQWFQVDRIAALNLDPTLFPEASPAVYADLRESLLRYLDAVFWEEGTMEALFAGRFAFVNDRIAPLFGVPPPGSDELVRVELDPDERAGILTQPGWLAHRAHQTVHSPIFRGTFVLEHVLCAPTPPAPPSAESMTTPLPPGTVVTTRERTVRSHTGACAGCHARIDGVGFLFEHYDALGRYRIVETDLSLPIDASGMIRGAGDLDGPVTGAVELGERLATSPQAGRCVAQHYMRYALGRTLTEEDLCTAEALRRQLAATGGDLRELLVALVLSPSFRTRSAIVP